MNNKIISIIKAVAFIAIAIYISITFQSSLSNLVIKSGITWVFGSILLRLVISIAFARGMYLIFKTLNIKLKGVFTAIIGFVLGFGVSFAFEPIYNTDYGNFGDDKSNFDVEKLQSLTSNQFSTNNKPALVVFFSTGCPHCKVLSNKLGDLYKNDQTPQIVTIFPGEKAAADEFISMYNGDAFQYHAVSDDDFIIKHTNGTFPSIFLIDENMKSVMRWGNDELNYSAFDLIKSYK